MQAMTYPTLDKVLQQTRRPGVPPRAARPAHLADARGCSVSGATSAALGAYERAFAANQSWRTGADAPLELALREAPGFVMAHVLQAYLLLCNRDPQRARMALPVFERAAALPANERERMHLATIGAALADNFNEAKARLGELLQWYPRDALALQVAHVFDYVTGDAERMRERVEAVLPAWSPTLPGYAAVLAMHAFSLEECGDYERAEDRAAQVLALDPLNARAHHAMAHVFEMTGRGEAGVRWMEEHAAGWATDTVVATHCWWHLGLFHLAEGRLAPALECYDQRIRATRSLAIADLIDASALLWRIALAGADTGTRWAELAAAWAPRIDDGFCSFNDLHAVLAFVGGAEWGLAQRLERKLAESQALPTRHGATTRLLGLPACRAMMAFGRGDYTLAITLLASLPAQAHRLGGSHAQRDVLNLTLLKAVERVRRRRPAQQAVPA
ncbi:MAG: tetratricopeptide repeat protein [Massilia sp.]